MAAPRPCTARAAIRMIGRRRQRAAERGYREDAEARHEDSLGAQAIAQGAGGQDECGKRDGVGRDHPLQLGHAAAQRRADAVQRGVDDGDVELHDAIAETHGGERQRLYQSAVACSVRIACVMGCASRNCRAARGKSSHGWADPFSCDASIVRYGIAGAAQPTRFLQRRDAKETQVPPELFRGTGNYAANPNSFSALRK